MDLRGICMFIFAFVTFYLIFLFTLLLINYVLVIIFRCTILIVLVFRLERCSKIFVVTFQQFKTTNIICYQVICQCYSFGLSLCSGSANCIGYFLYTMPQATIWYIGMLIIFHTTPLCNAPCYFDLSHTLKCLYFSINPVFSIMSQLVFMLSFFLSL